VVSYEKASFSIYPNKIYPFIDLKIIYFLQDGDLLGNRWQNLTQKFKNQFLKDFWQMPNLRATMYAMDT
jgi:hypothetical protein